jgi:adenosylcobinamide kinase/adenosylcobinamide-phosphate guanylyltransferase
MQIFISGGCKNGKSTLAQQLAARQRRPGGHLYYLATLRPADPEDEARVARHVAERAGMGFQTVELPLGIGQGAARCHPGGSLLLDSLTALLANEMFRPGFDPAAPERVWKGLGLLLDRFPDLVLVSDFIYADGGVYDPTTEAYRQGLALLDRRCAQACGAVLELCAGRVTAYKGGPALAAAQLLDERAVTV